MNSHRPFLVACALALSCVSAAQAAQPPGLGGGVVIAPVAGENRTGKAPKPDARGSAKAASRAASSAHR